MKRISQEFQNLSGICLLYRERLKFLCYSGLFLFMLLLLPSTYCKAQESPYIDSLEAQTKNQDLEIADRIRAHLSLGIAYNATNSSRGLYHRFEALKLAEANGLKRLAFRASYNLGTYYTGKSNLSLGQQYFEKALSITRETADHDDENLCLVILGEIMSRQARYVDAITYLQDGLELARNREDSTLTTTALNTLGTVHEKLENFPFALDYYRQAMAIAIVQNDTNMIARLFNNMGNGMVGLDSLAKAEYYFMEAYQIKQRSNQESGIIASLHNLGILYRKKGEPDKAFQYHMQALQLEEKLGDNRGKASSLSSLGQLYLEKQDCDAAINSASRAFTIARNLNLPQELLAAAQVLHRCYESQGKYEEAYFYLGEVKYLQDSLFNLANEKKIVRLELDRMGLENATLQQQNDFQATQIALRDSRIQGQTQLTLLISIGAGLLIVLAVVLILNNNRRKRINRILEQQNREIESQKEEISRQADLLREANAEISRINSGLEVAVSMRTAELESQNRQLAEYAFINGHLLRGPLASIMGLIELFREGTLSDREQELVELLGLSAGKLDEIIHQINEAVGEGEHFSRGDLN